MIYFSLAVFLFCGWYLPWWCLALTAFLLGLVVRDGSAVRGDSADRGDFAGNDNLAGKVSLSGAISWASLAYLRDGQSHGLISQRLSGLFSLPSAVFIFGVMAILSGVTVLLCFKSGNSIRSLFGTGMETGTGTATGTGTGQAL